MKKALLSVCVLAAVMMPPRYAAAQVKSSGDTDITKYRATMADMRAFANATRNLNDVAKANPKLAPKTRANLQELDKLAPTIESEPLLRQAVQKAGLSAQKYQMLNQLTAVMGFATVMSDADVRAMLAQTGIHPENLEFFKKHANEISALNRAANQ